MASNTTNYGWTKPDYEDDADIMVINSTIDSIDEDLKAVDTNKQDKETGKGLSTNDYTNADKAAVEDWKNGYIYRTTSQNKAITLDPTSAYFVVITFGSNANFYFMNSTSTTAYNKALVEQIEGITRTIDGLTVTFSSETVTAFTLFARKLN